MAAAEVVAYKKEYSLTQMGGHTEGNNGNAEDNSNGGGGDGPQGFITFAPKDIPAPLSSSIPEPPSLPKQNGKEKKKWSLFGVFKKKDKKGESSKSPEKEKSKPLQHSESKNNINQATLDKMPSGTGPGGGGGPGGPAGPGNADGATDNNESEPSTPKETEEKPPEKKIVPVSSLAELPDECHRLIRQSGIPQEKLEENFKILLRVLHFRTGVIYRVPEDIDTPSPPPLPKSTRFRPGAELVTELGELKKTYKEIDEVGKGGFGTVFHARAVREKNKLVAIKKMPHTTRKQKNSNFHEASILNACNHPNIVKFVTCHEVKDELWIAMEYLEGGTFEEAAKAWNFNEANLAYVAKELLKGISYLHANQLAHRDLKSANIMMSIQGQVKLIDFGLCADMSVGFPRHMVGSPFWMPPEMIQGKPHTYAVDVWSFAISLLEMANQRPPMIESAVKAMFTVATEGCTQFFVDPDKWTDTFKEFLGLCLKVDPEERATADQLLKHPFIQLADTRTNMEHILRRIFLSNSLINSGF